METALPSDQPRTPGASRWGLALPLLAAMLVMLTFLTIPPAPVDLKVDTDTSFIAVLDYAQQHGLQFGPDLVCTYGPLGYLIFYYYSPNTPVLRMAVDVVFCFTVGRGAMPGRLASAVGVAVPGRGCLHVRGRQSASQD